MAKLTNRDEFENWLKDQPKEWVQVLVARIALRILPMAYRSFGTKSLKSGTQQELTFSTFRAVSVSWVASRYPVNDMHVAARAAARAAPTAAYAAPIVFRAAAYAARIAGYFAASIASRSHAATAADIATADDIWAAIDADVGFLNGADEDAQAAAKYLAGKDLWLNRTTPKWCVDALDRLEYSLLDLDGNWHVWTQWYHPLLYGQPGWGLSAKNAEDLIVRITTQDKDFWDRGATEVNAEIARWLEETRVEEGERKNGVEKTNLTGSDIVPDLVAAIQKARVNHDQLVLTSAMLRMEIDEFKEKLRGDNELDPSLRDKLTALLDNHAEAVEEMITIAEKLPENVSDDDVNKFKPWFDTYLESVKNELPKYTDPKKFGKATIPAIIVGLSASIGLMFGMPAIFGAGALTMMGLNPAAKTIKEILKPVSSEK